MVATEVGATPDGKKRLDRETAPHAQRGADGRAASWVVEVDMGHVEARHEHRVRDGTRRVAHHVGCMVLLRRDPDDHGAPRAEFTVECLQRRTEPSHGRAAVPDGKVGDRTEVCGLTARIAP